MKVIKIVSTVCAAVLISFSAQAQSAEEVCHGAAESRVDLKHNMITYPQYFELALEKSNSIKKKFNREYVRESLFYVKNRLHLSDEDLYRLSFVDCLVKSK